MSFLLSPFLDSCAGACLSCYRCFTCSLQKRKKKRLWLTPRQVHTLFLDRNLSTSGYSPLIFLESGCFSTVFLHISLAGRTTAVPCPFKHRYVCFGFKVNRTFEFNAALTGALKIACKFFSGKYSIQTQPIIQINLTN